MEYKFLHNYLHKILHACIDGCSAINLNPGVTDDYSVVLPQGAVDDPIGSIVTFSCLDANEVLFGENNATCLAGGVWSPSETPTCTGKNQ